MAYLLAATPIKAPSQLEESNSTQMAQVRTLSGRVNRDYFGANKRSWVLSYRNASKADWDAIKAIRDNYQATETPVAWEVTETNYTISATTVHVDLEARGFRVGGEDYLSDFSLILKEA